MSKTYHFDITDKKIRAHVCDFEQNLDGSIYIKFPEFEFGKWFNDNGSQLISYNSPGKGKLSIHGSGIAHIKSYNQDYKAEFQVLGNPLLSKDKLSAGVRHIATIFPRKPDINQIIEESQDNNSLKPMVFIFFAVPFGLNINLQGSFNIDEYEDIPPINGIGNQPLRMHNIFWFSYRSKFMDNWPLATHVYFSNGYDCPLFVGVDKCLMRIDIRKPVYSIRDNKIVDITL